MLLVLVQMQRMLDLLAESLPVRRMAVSSVFLLVDISFSAALRKYQFPDLLFYFGSVILGLVGRTPVWKFSWPCRRFCSGMQSCEWLWL